MDGNLFEPLLSALRAGGQPVTALGMDLGTSKSCLAVASYHPVSDKLTVECVPYRDADERVAVIAMPSVVALEGDAVLVGRAAKREIGKHRRFLEKNLFVDSKNDMGLRYTYWKAPAFLQTATEVAKHIAHELIDRADPEGLGPWEELVATVPASFQGTQREATLEAVEELALPDHTSLLDEPYAAFLNFAFRHPEQLQHREGQTLLVFDFGGGTCDVAVFRLYRPGGAPMRARLIGTSRYHRLGGGDIDRLIVHRHLLPMLLKQNGMREADLDFRQKKVVLEPQLLALAESLKIALCKRIDAVVAKGGRADDDLDVMAQGEHAVEVADATLWLTDPTLNVAIFRTLMATMLATAAATHFDEFVRTASIFDPVRNAMERARLEPEEIDLVLLAGTSVLNPLVREAIAAFLPSAKLLFEPDMVALQGAVASGAALQAMSRAVLGKPIIEPCLSGTLALQTVAGAVRLLEAGMPLPVDSPKPLVLTPPLSTADKPVEIAIEVVADGDRVVLRRLWELAPPVRQGEPLHVDWHIDENQMLELSLSRVEQDGETLAFRMEAPVTHVDQGHQRRCQMLEREERIRQGEVKPNELGRVYEDIGHDARALGMPEKAAHMYNIALQHGRPAAPIRNWRGLCHWDRQDLVSAMREFEAAGDSLDAQFNLALALRNTKSFAKALQVIDQRLMRDDDIASRVLRADILDGSGRKEDARLQYRDALDTGTPPEDLNGFELQWLQRASSQLGDKRMSTAVTEERSRRSKASQDSERGQRVGVLPEVLRG